MPRPTKSAVDDFTDVESPHAGHGGDSRANDYLIKSSNRRARHAASAIDTSSEIAGPSAVPRNECEQYADGSFQLADPGRAAALEKMMRKFQLSARKCDLLKVKGGDVHSIRGSGIDDTSSAMVNVDTVVNNVREKNVPSSARVEQVTAPVAAVAKGKSSASSRAERIDIKRGELRGHAAIAAHAGGIPFPVFPRRFEVAVAHDELPTLDLATFSGASVAVRRFEMPQYGILIASRNVETMLVNSSERVMVFRGIVGRRSNAAQPAPAVVNTPYKSPTVESVSDFSG